MACLIGFSLLLSHCRWYSKRKKPGQISMFADCNVKKVNDLQITQIPVQKISFFELVFRCTALRPIEVLQLQA